ncbi:MAG: zinc ribbon domain-containing protein, partial [Acidimicrobiales bacterium]
RCSECEARFEARRPAELSDAPPPVCPSGHASTRRLLSVFATAGRATGASGAPAGESSAGCGPGCACASR